jgi:hypothetical protein
LNLSGLAGGSTTPTGSIPYQPELVRYIDGGRGAEVRVFLGPAARIGDQANEIDPENVHLRNRFNG